MLITVRVTRSLVLAVLAVLVVLASAWGAAADPASHANRPHVGLAAAVCPATDVPSSTKSARAVFTATVQGDPVASAKTGGARGATYTQTVAVQTVYQGRIRSSTVEVQTDRTPKECSLGALNAGQTYIFFAQGDGDPWVAVSGAGTALATSDLVASVESILGSGRPAVQPDPEEASFTELNPAAPHTFTRAAAPGVALVLIGLLGLAVVRSRRRG